MHMDAHLNSHELEEIPSSYNMAIQTTIHVFSIMTY